MSKIFNTSAVCRPEIHYMVDLSDRLEQIKKMVDRGDYFTINRARQYGKTTMLRALGSFLAENYVVVSLDFQMMSQSDFEKESSFSEAFAREVLEEIANIEEVSVEIITRLQRLADGKEGKGRLAELFQCLNAWCGQSKKPIVMLIDEVDSAQNNQVFLDFLAQLRGAYINRDKRPAFQSVILAGVYDVKNIKQRLRPDGEHRVNSPWNIAADFLLDMNFSVKDISGMLAEYESDYQTGMDIKEIAQFIYDYTSGYPFLVSRICKLMDERITGSEGYFDRKLVWTKEGVLEAVKILLIEKNTLFESITGKLADYPRLRELVYSLLFTGRKISYNPLSPSIEIAEMFGFIKNSRGDAVISNRIFETVLYNLFLSEEMLDSEEYRTALQERNQFIQNGHLNMKLILEKFVVHWGDLYSSADEKFIEDNARKFFLLYLKPIINGTGNYYIEAQTRDNKRTDVIIDYCKEQFVIEMKIWRGNAYHERGEKQLAEYLEYYHLNKGYMLSFSFNKKKQAGVKEIRIGNKVLIEAVV
ncbi:ATP-binding protein [Hominisplanchenecus murintestinalis]|uniref:ATP-binding protein n=1 Tax=Hominisplanchenecus murintestinalis TaxID=2941517 RepID=UPI000EA16EBF|nr:ATP-binding protein [Hominisplanchenecus murintestinalis]NBH97370.1 ATP-binding protein [Lachnospiraceae bacterium]NBI74496.1 ATP-binding protein [Lachnospiraceae bacterium]RKJ96141.1 ATP-binding protein [Anaerotruncus sp. 1XD22-93]